MREINSYFELEFNTRLLLPLHWRNSSIRLTHTSIKKWGLCRRPIGHLLKTLFLLYFSYYFFGDIFFLSIFGIKTDKALCFLSLSLQSLSILFLYDY